MNILSNSITSSNVDLDSQTGYFEGIVEVEFPLIDGTSDQITIEYTSNLYIENGAYIVEWAEVDPSACKMIQEREMSKISQDIERITKETYDEE